MTTLSRASSTLLIAGMTLALFLGAFVGFRLLTASATIEEPPTCEVRTVAPGEAVTPNLVSVDVFNGSERAGLANRVSINLQRRGFLPGQVGNSEIDVESDGVTIVTATPDDASVRLVASQFGRTVEFVEPAGSQAGENIVVIVGNDTNEDLADGAAEQVETDTEFSVCLEVAPEVATDQE